MYKNLIFVLYVIFIILFIVDYLGTCTGTGRARGRKNIGGRSGENNRAGGTNEVNTIAVASIARGEDLSTIVRGTSSDNDVSIGGTSTVDVITTIVARSVESITNDGRTSTTSSGIDVSFDLRSTSLGAARCNRSTNNSDRARGGRTLVDDHRGLERDLLGGTRAFGTSSGARGAAAAINDGSCLSDGTNSSRGCRLDRQVEFSSLAGRGSDERIDGASTLSNDFEATNRNGGRGGNNGSRAGDNNGTRAREEGSRTRQVGAGTRQVGARQEGARAREEGSRGFYNSSAIGANSSAEGTNSFVSNETGSGSNKVNIGSTSDVVYVGSRSDVVNYWGRSEVNDGGGEGDGANGSATTAIKRSCGGDLQQNCVLSYVDFYQLISLEIADIF